MRFEQLKNLSNTKFRRYTGLKRDNFDIIVLIVSTYQRQTKIKAGRPCNLSVEDQLVMLLEYYRESRTFFHLGVGYGLSESNVQRTIVRLEDILMRSGYFRLEGKKALLSDKNIDTIIVDVTETPAQRPKKKAKQEKCKAFL